MTLHAAYAKGTMLTEIMNMMRQDPGTVLKEFLHIDAEGETALSLVLKIEASDFFVMSLLQMDKWALGVRCKKTGNFPVHVVYQKKFTNTLRAAVATDSRWIVCSYNNDGNTVLHLALQSKCDMSIEFLVNIVSNADLMLSAFIHENNQGKIPLELAIENRHECCSNALIFKILEFTFVSGYGCEMIFVKKLDNIVVFDHVDEEILMFASFMVNSCDFSLHYHKTEYEYFGRTIELESKEDCEKSVTRKQHLICSEYEDNLFRRITSIRKGHRVDYDYWMEENTLRHYMNAMKIMKKARAKEKADEAQLASIEGRCQALRQENQACESDSKILTAHLNNVDPVLLVMMPTRFVDQ